MERDAVHKEEEQYLQKTVAEMERQIAMLNQIPRYYGDNITEQALDAMRVEEKYHLEKGLNEPYFGRMDFLEQGKDQAMHVYIGKSGVSDERSRQLLVIDWRAPIASLFYSFTGGEELVSYESPDGIVEGSIDLKRNIVIREQNIQRIVDSYVRGQENLGVTDEFLLYRLGENKDHRLRDIVSTIQEEQNAIIRSPKDQPLIIQGVAGSGKTTVALHRIAYLLYEYRDQLRASEMIIFAPSRMFLDYISNVLPELGVSGIQQTTFSQWAVEQLEDELILVNQRQQWDAWFAVNNPHRLHPENSSAKFKGSLGFMDMIEAVIRQFERSSTPTEDFEPWDGVVLKVEEIRRWLLQDYAHLSITHKRERVITRIKKWMEKQLEEIWDQKLQRERKKKSNAKLKSYLKHWPALTAFDFYQQLFMSSKKSIFPPNLLDTIPQEILKNTAHMLKKQQIAEEDVAALLYIHDRLNGIERSQLFDHIVIDEAQDFSPFQIAVLRQRVRSASMTILGDIAQSIHTNQGITEWKAFQQMFAGAAGFFQLRRSYRSTMEIIYFANQILFGQRIGVESAEPVFRSGEVVKLLQIDAHEQVHHLVSLIQHLQSQHVSSIAVVGRTEQDCQQMHQQLLIEGLGSTLIDAKNQEYSGGISVLPIYLTKGLEFDAVIIVGVTEDNYQDHAEDAKLLYVGCTRALHHLMLLYDSHPSALVARIDPSYYTIQ